MHRPGETRLIPYEDFRSAVDSDGTIRADRRWALSTPVSPPTHVDSGALVRQITSLAAIPAHERSAAIDARIAQSLDGKRLRERLQDFESATVSLRVLLRISGIVAFILFPISTLFAALHVVIIPAMALTLLLSGLTAVWTARVWRRFYVERPTSDKWAILAKTMLYPVSALRPLEALSLPLLSAWHPGVLALTLCDRKTAHLLIRELWAELCYARAAKDATPTAEAALRNHHDREAKALLALLKHHNVNLVEILQPPCASSDTSQTYCPKCRAQYIYASGNCADCEEMPLLPLTQPMSSTPSN